ncbi:hypothetical protein BJ138DRAFT_1020872 [Hygrophoropsis aurantiaca]|uniref:Uncharacterized protein n=1 Tax=Hygrophoropsis aurantiaca TaxID=72124 RepID=A0ACB7ZSH6_9AGAM|nr:hypothetical protein BJ138DRAFT_1020872 [Hygrophoropsis aurantiaca]
MNICSELNLQQREALDDAPGPFSQDHGDSSGPSEDYQPDYAAAQPPVGEEGFGVSHEGGEFDLYNSIDTLLSKGPTKRVDTRDRRDRLMKATVAWQEQYGELADAFLEYQHEPLSPLDTLEEPINEDTFAMEVIDVFSKRTSSRINACLIRQGCIRASPMLPTVAITIRTLELYRETHRVSPRLSIHAEAKKLCRLHNVAYHRYLADQLRTAYDVYLEIQRIVDRRIKHVLGHDTLHWRMQNSCPACQYKVVNEPPLRFSFLCAMDGNNSLKLVDSMLRWGSERYDPRDARSDIWMTEEFVDQYKNEVRSSRQAPSDTPTADETPNPNDPDSEWSDIPEGDDSAEPTDVCISRWRNASPEAQKKI